MNAPITYGVFPHMGFDGRVTGRGYVARDAIDGAFAAPYNSIKPVKTFKRAHAAQRLATKLTYGDDVPASEPVPANEPAATTTTDTVAADGPAAMPVAVVVDPHAVVAAWYVQSVPGDKRFYCTSLIAADPDGYASIRDRALNDRVISADMTAGHAASVCDRLNHGHEPTMRAYRIVRGDTMATTSGQRHSANDDDAPTPATAEMDAAPNDWPCDDDTAARCVASVARLAAAGLVAYVPWQVEEGIDEWYLRGVDAAGQPCRCDDNDNDTYPLQEAAEQAIERNDSLWAAYTACYPATLETAHTVPTFNPDHCRYALQAAMDRGHSPDAQWQPDQDGQAYWCRCAHCHGPIVVLDGRIHALPASCQAQASQNDDDATPADATPADATPADATRYFDPTSRITWLAFPGKPDEATRAALKARGWRWSGARALWHTNARVPVLPTGLICDDGGTVDYAEGRAARLEQRASKKVAEATAQWARADDLAGRINGQPILIGHHSEKRARRDQERLQDWTQKGVAAYTAAERLADAAESSRRHQARHDDPGVIKRRIDRLGAERVAIVNQHSHVYHTCTAECAAHRDAHLARIDAALAENHAALDTVGGIPWDTLQPQAGDVVRAQRHGLVVIVKINAKTFKADGYPRAHMPWPMTYDKSEVVGIERRAGDTPQA